MKRKRQNVWQQKSVQKFQLAAFFDCKMMTYQHICPSQQRLNAEYYTTIFKQLLLVRILRKCPQLSNNWILHQDNTPPCKACLARATRCNFLHIFLRTISQQTTIVFLHYVHAAVSSACLCWWFVWEGKLSLSKSIFKLNSVPPYGMWTQLYLILAVLLPTFTHVSAILRIQVVRSPQK